MTLSDSLDPKIEGRCKQHAIIFYGDRVIPLALQIFYKLG